MTPSISFRTLSLTSGDGSQTEPFSAMRASIVPGNKEKEKCRETRCEERTERCVSPSGLDNG